MRNLIRTSSAVMAAAAMLAGVGAAAARDRSPADATHYYGMAQTGSNAAAAQVRDGSAFDASGTRGRIGLGESPFHPEGPGNFSD